MRVVTEAKTPWEGVIGYFNEHKKGTHFLRREFKTNGISVNGKEVSMAYIDQSILLLKRAGYLQHVADGVYKLTREIPNSKRAVRRQAARGGILPSFMQRQIVDLGLAHTIGLKSQLATRTEVIKKLWAYIKLNGLQDPKNPRLINFDAELQAVFGEKTATMFELTKMVTAKVHPQTKDLK
jgi:upstream activation factor subunit UAF30